ncbi:amino acid--[acyl-carrier-protein] ligase [Burkholderia gladioli]|uniref:Seryl-tRNA synthetase n=1 Tax=Burkholderia gladioli (strain BSR3) TaxID=999541 RepID=F2LDB9_BURGS|nr:amino acid--[acyl-carrier-protein] ligase [Burkholderia gladioli]AEA60222.1 Seryl-tRNA synthetase [Burkholderia gladioli BSR3]MBW5283944.1 amino acid--[acyl-carrier-protein] ligase [Burkholderia gladioli]CAG9191941.1 Amino acid--(acyl-carrier-protein) ligase [Burkholderia gladioli]
MSNLAGLSEAPDQQHQALQHDDTPFLTELLDAGLLISTGVDGLYGRSAAFEDVVERVNQLIGRWGQGKDVEVIRFPPAMNRQILEEAGYWKHFPDQIGSVFCFSGDELGHQRLLKCLDNQEDWTEDLKPTRLAVTPVACYPLYPVMAARGQLPAGGRVVDIFSYCCRHEPSKDPERMLMFRQREFVCLGTPEQVQAFREDLMAYAQEAMAALGLPVSIDLANDPFFGRIGKVMADSQRRNALKYELLVAGINPGKLTACGSFNYHTDRFSELWKIHTASGEIAHTGCCGFGLERLSLGLFRHHGFDTAAWPPSVRAMLWGEAA